MSDYSLGMQKLEVSQSDGAVCLKLLDGYHSSHLVLLNAFVLGVSKNLI